MKTIHPPEQLPIQALALIHSNKAFAPLMRAAIRHQINIDYEDADGNNLLLYFKDSDDLIIDFYVAHKGQDLTEYYTNIFEAVFIEAAQDLECEGLRINNDCRITCGEIIIHRGDYWLPDSAEYLPRKF